MTAKSADSVYEHVYEKSGTEAPKTRNVHFAQPAIQETHELQALMLRTFEDRQKEEQLMLRPFAEVLMEPFSKHVLDSFILYRATDDPKCVLPWLISNNLQHGFIRYLRDQMFPLVTEETFDVWVRLLKKRRDEDIFWSFVTAMTLDEGIELLVKKTWKGSPRSLECIMEYFKVRLFEMLETPFDPDNANDLMVGMWGVIRHEVLVMNMRCIILNGILKPVIVPLSRNAHRMRKQEMRQQEHEEASQMAADGL